MANKFVFSKFNEKIAKKVLSKGATLPVAGKILGNTNYLSQTKNKKKIGIDDYQYSGRPSKGRPRIYYSKSEMSQGDLVYPISEMNDFNTRLANELFYFHLFGYSIKDLTYEHGKKIARVDFIETNEDNKCDEFQITFLDLSEVRYLKVAKDNCMDKNLFILPTESEEDLENVAISQEQKELLSLSSEDFSVVVATIVNKTEYYEINEHGGSIFRTHSFLKRNGEYEKSIFKFDLSKDQESQLLDYQITDDDRKAQLTNNGFAMKDGKIVELDNKNSNVDLSDFAVFLLDQFKDEYVIANRYFEKRYMADSSLDTSTIDQILDDIAVNLDQKTKITTFAELEMNTFPEFLDSSDDIDATEEDNAVSGEFASLFEGKEQGVSDDKVQTGKLERDTSKEQEAITTMSGNTEDKDLPKPVEDKVEESKEETVVSENEQTKEGSTDVVENIKVSDEQPKEQVVDNQKVTVPDGNLNSVFNNKVTQ